MFYKQFKEYPNNQFKEKTQQERKNIKSIDWNCSGTYLASGDTTIKIWGFDGNNIKRATDIKQGSEQLEKLLFHPTQPDIIASVTKENVKIWDIRNKQHIRQEKKELSGAAAWSVSGNELAIGVKQNKESQIHFMDLGGINDKQLVYQLKEKDKTFELKSIQYDPLGDVIAVGGTQNGVGQIQLLDAKNPVSAALETFEAHRAAVSSIRFTKDGKYLITGGMDSLIQIWQLPDLLIAGNVLNIESEIKGISINYDDQYFAAIGNEEQTYIYSIEQCVSGKSDQVHQIKLEGQAQEICFHPNKHILCFVCYDKNKQESVIHLYGNLGV